jgi:hypothetical protein
MLLVMALLKQGARAVAGWVLLAVFLFAPLVPSLVAQENVMGCCRKGKLHACCKRNAKTKGVVLQAVSQYGKNCCKMQLPGSASALPAPVPTTHEFLVATMPFPLAGTGASALPPLPSSLFQRPPPASLFI